MTHDMWNNFLPLTVASRFDSEDGWWQVLSASTYLQWEGQPTHYCVAALQVLWWEVWLMCSCVRVFILQKITRMNWIHTGYPLARLHIWSCYSIVNREALDLALVTDQCKTHSLRMLFCLPQMFSSYFRCIFVDVLGYLCIAKFLL